MELTTDNLGSFISDFQAKLLTEGNADQIAAAFEARGIRAECGSSEQCAIAVALQHAVAQEFGLHPNDVEPGVGCTTIGVKVGGPEEPFVGVATSSQLIQFIGRFDSGVYPNLISRFDYQGRKMAALTAEFIRGVARSGADVNNELLRVQGIPKP